MLAISQILSHCTTTVVYIQTPYYDTCKSKEQQTATFNYHAIATYMLTKLCPSNATYMLHIQIRSCADIIQLCQYMCSYISHYCHMPLNKELYHNAHIMSHCTSTKSAYRSNITVHITKKIIIQLTPHVPHIHHMSKLFSVHLWGKYANICHIWTHLHQPYDQECTAQTMTTMLTTLPDCVSWGGHWLN